MQPEYFQSHEQACAELPARERPTIEIHDLQGNLRSLRDIEGDILCLALQLYGGRLSEVARRLGIGRSTLYRKLDYLQSRWSREHIGVGTSVTKQ